MKALPPLAIAASVVCSLAVTACVVDSDSLPDEEVGEAASAICNDPGNDTEATATDLGDTTDCDDDGGFFDDVVRSGRIDWYRYHIEDQFGCLQNPGVSVAPSTVSVCQYFQCDVGTPSFTCPAGTRPATSPGGRPGCCGSGSFDVTATCTGFADDMEVYLRFSTSSSTCTDYDVDYHG